MISDVVLSPLLHENLDECVFILFTLLYIIIITFKLPMELFIDSVLIECYDIQLIIIIYDICI